MTRRSANQLHIDPSAASRRHSAAGSCQVRRWLAPLSAALAFAAGPSAWAEVVSTHGLPQGPVPGTNNQASITIVETSPCTTCPAPDTETTQVQPGSFIDWTYDTVSGAFTISDAAMTMSDLHFLRPLPFQITGVTLNYDHTQPAAVGQVVGNTLTITLPMIFAGTLHLGGTLLESIPAPIPITTTFTFTAPDAHGVDSIAIGSSNILIPTQEVVIGPLPIVGTVVLNIGGSITLHFNGPFDDPIHLDGFESDDLSQWSNLSNTDGGNLSVDAAAALQGTNFGLDLQVNDINGMYAQDDSPNAAAYYRAQFYLDPHTFDPGEVNNAFRARVFIAFSNPSRRLLAVVLKRQGGNYSIEARARKDDNSQSDTGFFAITNAVHKISFELTRSTNADSNDGVLKFYVDDVLKSTLTGIDNSQTNVDFVRIGAMSLKNGANGVLYLDEFQSFDSLPIAP